MTKPSDESIASAAQPARVRRRGSRKSELSQRHQLLIPVLDHEVESIQRILLFVIEPLIRAAPEPTRSQVLGVLSVFAEKAKTGPRNAKRYDLEARLQKAWTLAP